MPNKRRGKAAARKILAQDDQSNGKKREKKKGEAKIPYPIRTWRSPSRRTVARDREMGPRQWVISLFQQMTCIQIPLLSYPSLLVFAFADLANPAPGNRHLLHYTVTYAELYREVYVDIPMAML